MTSIGSNLLVISEKAYKVQADSKGFFKLTLPQHWTQAFSIKKGARVNVSILSDGSLLVKLRSAGPSQSIGDILEHDTSPGS